MGFISAPGPLELMVILVVALIVLGPAKLRQPLGSIMACEAAHRVALRNALGRRPLVD